MNSDTAFSEYSNDDTEQCYVKPLTCAEDTLRRLLTEINSKLQEVKQNEPQSKAVTVLEQDLKLLDVEYEKIPIIINDYKKKMDEFEQKLSEAEKQHKELESLTNDQQNPGDEIRGHINQLHDEYNNRETQLKNKYMNERTSFLTAKNCHEQSETKKIHAQLGYETHKNYQRTVSGWFDELSSLYNTAKELVGTGDYRTLYAYRLEFEGVLGKASAIPLETTKGKGRMAKQGSGVDGLKADMTKKLRAWAIAAYGHFCWQLDWLHKEKAEIMAKDMYETFMSTRREDFIREAMDVPADETQVC